MKFEECGHFPHYAFRAKVFGGWIVTFNAPEKNYQSGGQDSSEQIVAVFVPDPKHEWNSAYKQMLIDAE